MQHAFYSFLMVLFLVGCSSALPPPKNPENICKIFEQYPDWYEDARAMREDWGTPISLAMAFVKQESSFIHDAKTPKQYSLGFIPRGRKSSSLGYSQALDGTWSDFEKATDKKWDRTEFYDALQFIGWYTSSTKKKLNLPYSDVYVHYGAYYSGLTGVQRGAASQKERQNQQALAKIAQRVSKQAATYKSQLLSCESALKKKPWWKF